MAVQSNFNLQPVVEWLKNMDTDGRMVLIMFSLTTSAAWAVFAGSVKVTNDRSVQAPREDFRNILEYVVNVGRRTVDQAEKTQDDLSSAVSTWTRASSISTSSATRRGSRCRPYSPWTCPSSWAWRRRESCRLPAVRSKPRHRSRLCPLYGSLN